MAGAGVDFGAVAPIQCTSVGHGNVDHNEVHMKKLMILFLTGFLTTASNASVKSLTIDSARTLRVEGSISKDIVKTANQLMNLANKSRKPIYIVINSQGGLVAPGSIFLNAMQAVQARGVKLFCIVPTMAMSMAMTIFATCQHRYAMPHARLLWHRMSFGLRGRLTIQDLSIKLKEYRAIEKAILDPVRNIMKMPEVIFRYHLDNETQHVASILKASVSPKAFEIIEDVIGVDNLFPEPKKERISFDRIEPITDP
jgi:ATP-dependent protease ClpP protease subunit